MDNNMNNNSNEPTIEQIKQSLDIITVAEMYGELVKSGSNYKFKNDSSKYCLTKINFKKTVKIL